MFGTKGIFLHSGRLCYKISVSNEIICVFNKHHIHVILLHYSDHPWNIVCSVEVGLSKQGYGKMPPKKAYVLVLRIVHKVYCMTTCTKF